jgi:hypothetical protein
VYLCILSYLPAPPTDFPVSLKSDISRGSLCISHACSCTRISHRSLCVFLESHITDLLVFSLVLSFVKQKIGLITKHFSEQNSLIEYKISPRSFPSLSVFYCISSECSCISPRPYCISCESPCIYLGSLCIPRISTGLPRIYLSPISVYLPRVFLYLPLSPIHDLAISL